MRLNEHHVTAKKEDYASYEAEHRCNVPPSSEASPIEGAVDADGMLISRRKKDWKTKVRGIWICDNNPCADPRLWFNSRCNMGTQRWRKANVQQAIWVEDWNKVGRRHIHCFIYLEKPEKPWLLFHLLGTGIDLDPVAFFHQEEKCRNYMKKKVRKFGKKEHYFIDGLNPTSLPRRRHPTEQEFVLSASEEDTDSDGVLDLRGELESDEEFELRWNLIE